MFRTSSSKVHSLKALIAPSLAALTLAACSQGDDAGQGVSPPAPQPAATTPASPEQDINALKPDGWGALRIGMTRAQVVEALGDRADPNAVGGAEPEVCDQFRPARAPDNLLVMIEQGMLTRISVSRASELKTDKGFGLGDDAAAIKAAYGGQAQVSPHKYVEAPAEYITVWTDGPSAQPYREDATARGVVYEIGADGKVSAIHVGGPSIQYVEGCS